MYNEDTRVMSVHEAEAEKLFYEGYNCAQAVFVALADRYGIEHELALRLSASFGGGMGRMREVCGAVSGMLMAVGMETGQVKEKDPQQKARNYQAVQKLAGQFRGQNGSIICKELLGLTDKEKQAETHVPAERTQEYYKKRPCPELIKMAVRIFEENFPEEIPEQEE